MTQENESAKSDAASRLKNMPESLWIFIIALVAFFLGLLYWFFFFVPAAASTATVDINGLTIHLDVAVDRVAHMKGLSGRKSMPMDAGMLFVFPEPARYSFWMGGMRFPIDIVWLAGGQVVDLATLGPPTVREPIPRSHMPVQAADRVLELNAGQAAELGIILGSRIILPQ